jgi:hypothetical protein
MDIKGLYTLRTLVCATDGMEELMVQLKHH